MQELSEKLTQCCFHCPNHIPPQYQRAEWRPMPQIESYTLGIDSWERIVSKSLQPETISYVERTLSTSAILRYHGELSSPTAHVFLSPTSIEPSRIAPHYCLWLQKPPRRPGFRPTEHSRRRHVEYGEHQQMPGQVLGFRQKWPQSRDRDRECQERSRNHGTCHYRTIRFPSEEP